MTSRGNDQLVRSYLELRKGIGVLGVALPVVLPLGVLVFGSAAPLQDSISAYHGTVMVGVFVGVLFAIGVFLFSYVGYEPAEDKPDLAPSDNLAGNLACVFALGVALFPTTSESTLVRTIHFASAAALFLTLAYFSLFLFTRTKAGSAPGRQKELRNRVYRACGITIVVCIVLIPLYNLLLADSALADVKPVFWLESVALWAFGWAWFIKGEGLAPLNDRHDPGKRSGAVSETAGA